MKAADSVSKTFTTKQGKAQLTTLLPGEVWPRRMGTGSCTGCGRGWFRAAASDGVICTHMWLLCPRTATRRSSVLSKAFSSAVQFWVHPLTLKPLAATSDVAASMRTAATGKSAAAARDENVRNRLQELVLLQMGGKAHVAEVLL